MKTKILTAIIVCIFCFPVLTSFASDVMQKPAADRIDADAQPNITAEEQMFFSQNEELYSEIKASNDRLSEKNHARINATITLNAPISVAELKEYAADNGVTVKFITGRLCRDSQGLIVSFGRCAEDIDLDNIKEETDAAGNVIKTITAIQGYVSSDGIKAVESDEHTLLIDTTAFSAGEKDSFPPDVYWDYDECVNN